MTAYTFQTTRDPLPEQVAALQARLRAYNVARVGSGEREFFSVEARSPSGVLVGGMHGWISWGWLYIDTAWVEESLRNQGLGRELVRRCEEHARGCGIKQARVNTGSFQALGFWQKSGYQTFAQLDIIAPDGSPQIDYFLKKSLTWGSP